jgi:adenylate cyclase
MVTLDQISTPQEINLLVAFFDLTGFARFSRSHSARQIFDIFSEYYQFVGDLVEESGGKVVKFVGDAGLIVYSEELVNQGVLALKTLKDSGDTWLTNHKIASRNIITAHFGPIVCGQVGTRTDKRFDLFGETVNTAATLKSNGLAITPQLFRRLNPDIRKQFKKHTPPITYIPVDEPHQD